MAHAKSSDPATPPQNLERAQTSFQRVVFKISRPGLLYFGYLPDVRFLKPVFKEISNNYVFKAATIVE